MAVSSWTGVATMQIISNQNLPDSYIPTDKLLENPLVTWTPRRPEGTSNGTLQATFTPGYVVSYNVTYELNGSMYTDPYKDSYFDIYTNYTNSANSVVRMYNSTSQSTKSVWNYGPNGDLPVIKVSPLPAPPLGITYSTRTTNVCQCGTVFGNDCCHRPTGVTLNMYVTINVALNCGTSNLGLPICRDICSANPEACKVDYDTFCLDNNNPDNIALPYCTSFYGNWIKNRGSDTYIDTQAKLYCRKYYKGFEDLNPNNGDSKIPILKRQYDTQICSCNLTTPDEAIDPGLTLYQNYFDNLVKQYPGYATYGEQVRCTFNPCATSLFLTKEIPVKGCQVPQCINDVSVDNAGVINGDINISTVISGCGTIVNGSLWDAMILIVIVVIVIALILIILFYFVYSPRKARKFPATPSGAVAATKATT